MSKYRYLWGNYQAHWTSVEAYLSAFLQLPHLIPWNQCKNKFQISRDNRLFTFQSVDDLDADKERGKLFLEGEFFETFMKEVEQRCNEHTTFFASLKAVQWQNLSNQELFDLLLQAQKQWQLTISYFKPTQEEGMYHVVDTIQRAFTKEEASLLMIPLELDVLNQEQLAWQQIVHFPYSEQRILAHVEEYPWLAASHFTLRDVVNTMSGKYNYDKGRETFNNIHQEKSELQRKQESIVLQKPEMRLWVYRAQQLAMSRMKVKSCWAGTEFYTLPLFGEISRRTGEDVYDLTKYYFLSEINSLLFEKIGLSAQEKEKRRKCTIGLLKDGKLIIKSGDEAEKIAKQELAELYEIGDTNEVKGAVANPGKIRGRVRVLQSNNIQQNNELRQNFQKGDILITQMTQPNIVDIASKAGAIVTEEGGLLSHAAIISREFKIPCIVGTHIATTVFKDGEMVEVDAQAGVVRKL